MTPLKMHENEVETDAYLVRRLLAARFPQWEDLPLRPVPSAETDHALYRLGDEMAIRLPRIDWAIGQAEKEHKWMPVLARSCCYPSLYHWRWDPPLRGIRGSGPFTAGTKARM
jgi:aminoglycoside phosphotransferase (APT) family kinase protein